MPRHWSRFLLVIALGATSLIWNATAPGPARGAAKGGSFTVAETVISKFGTIGAWLFPQPPGDRRCNVSIPPKPPRTRSSLSGVLLLFLSTGSRARLWTLLSAVISGVQTER